MKNPRSIVVRFAGTLLFAVLACFIRVSYADTTWVDAGRVSGVWDSTGSPYILYNGDVAIDSSDTLFINPGVKITSSGSYGFEIQGCLRAIGLEGDSILFTIDTIAHPSGWKGLRFNHPMSASELSYCIIENGRAVQPLQGGGIFLDHASIVSHHTTIRFNRSFYGGGIYGVTSHSSFDSCTFSNNSATTTFDYGGGGIFFLDSSNISIESCLFSRNFSNRDGGGIACLNSVIAMGYSSFVLNTADNGGGIFCSSGNISLFKCQSSRNISYGSGGGLFLYMSTVSALSCFYDRDQGRDGGAMEIWNSSVTIDSCLFFGNNAWQASSYGGALHFRNNSGGMVSNCDFLSNTGVNGGAIGIDESSPWIYLCTFIGNRVIGDFQTGCGGAISVCPRFLNASTPTEPYVTRCSMAFNSARQAGTEIYIERSSPIFNSCLIYSSTVGAVFITNANNAQIVNSCVFAANGMGILGTYTQPFADLSEHLVNINGDTCDAFLNLFRDPILGDTTGGVLRITATSPCVDAADTLLQWDPDSTRADIGAAYFHHHYRPCSGFDLASPADSIDVEPNQGINFCWYPAQSPDPDTLTYTLHLSRSGSLWHLDAGTDTCLAILLAGTDPIEWWVTVHDLRPDTTIRSISQYRLFFGPHSEIRSDGLQPRVLNMHSPAPNPFNSSTSIEFELPKAQNVLLNVYDLLGRQVVSLADGYYEAGNHCVFFDGSSLSSGMYFARFQAGSFLQIEKLILLK